MQVKKFYTLLSFVSTFALLGISCPMIFLPTLSVHIPFALITSILFVLFCIVAFIMGKNAVKSENKYRFIQVTLMIIMGKMTLSLILVISYVEIFMPINKNFIVPFLANYLIFTAFEVYFLEKVAKEKLDH